MLAFFGWAMLGFVAGLLAQLFFAPLVVRVLGEKNFAELSLLDIGTLCVAGIFGGIVASALPRPWLAMAVLQLGLTVYAVLWLWFAGRGAGGKQWEIADGKLVRRREKTSLEPIFLWRREDYNQTDAYHGYSHYFLELHDASGCLARNGYRSEAEKDADEAALFAVRVGLRALDLKLVCRVEPLWWCVAGFDDDWTPLLCGPLDKLSEDERQWWRGWVLPRFDTRGEATIDAAQWCAQLESLQAAYPDFWRHTARRMVEEKRILPQFESSGNWNWTHRLLLLETALSQTEAPILAMSNAVFQESARGAMGKKGGTMCYNAEQRKSFVRLEPRT